MVIQSGSLMLLKIGRGLAPEQYVTVGGMRTTRFLLNNQMIDASHKESGKWRLLLDKAGISSLSISGSGVFTNSDAELILRQKAFSNQGANFMICFGNEDVLRGQFVISVYERIGNFAEEEGYNISLESSGEVTYSTYGDSLNKLGI